MISRDDLNPAQPRDLLTLRGFRSRIGYHEASGPRLAVSLEPIASILAVAFLLIAGYRSWSDSQPLLQRLAAGNAFLFLLLRLMFGHFDWPRRHPHISATTLVTAIAGYAMATIWLTGALWSTTHLAFVIVFMGFLYASRAWLYVTTLLICGGWEVLTFPQIQTESWSSMAGTLLAAIISSGSLFELRRITLSKHHNGVESSFQNSIEQESDSLPQQRAKAPWCSTCKASTDAIIRHNGEMIVDANSTATDLLGLSVSEMALLPVVGLFSIEKRDSLKSILRLGNFDPFETLAVGFNDECIPVKILNSGLPGDTGLKTLVMRDLRETEKLRLSVAAASRRSQQAFCRNRELAELARKQSRHTIEEKLKSLTQTVHRWLPCSVGCFVVLWDNSAENFSVVANSAANPLKTDALMAEDAHLVSQLINDGQRLIVPKVGEDQFRIRLLYSSEPVNAFCAFPLMTEDGMMGFFLVCDRNHREFAAEEIDYLTIVSQLITNACNHAMLEERLYLIDPHENTH